MILRVIKLLLVFSFAMLFTVVGLTNAFDYQTNWALLQHVMSMDGLPATSTVLWRAVTSEWVHIASYVVIVAFELSAAVLLWIAVFCLVRTLKTGDFEKAKRIANAGLFVGLFLYLFGFIVIGVEWFYLWQSAVHSVQYSAGLYAVLILLAMIYLNHKE